MRIVASSRPTGPYPELSWWGWGDPAQVPVLPDSVSSLLSSGLGVRAPTTRPMTVSEVSLLSPRLDAATVAALTEVVGGANAAADHETRVRHARGKSTPDLLDLRGGETLSAPDLVLAPGSHDEVLTLLQIASESRVAVVPFGGGTSVVGGLKPADGDFNGLVALDLRRMNALVSLDDESRLAELEPGLRGPQAEALLAAEGYTMGHFPQSFEYATLGGFAAARSSGQASAGYGRFDELVMGLKVATPAGSLVLGRAPKSAAGPDLRQLILGSEGTLGVITSLLLAIRPLPESRVYTGWRFRSFAQGTAALRRLAQDGPVPTVLRLSDEAETALNLVRPAELGEAGAGGCLAIVGYEGAAEEVRDGRGRAESVLEALGAEPDAQAGESWARDRYRGPYLRDALLDAGALVETLETVAFWSRVPKVYAAVSHALRESLSAQGAPPVILCHVSHVYPSGASLYFTVGCAALEQPREQWRQAKAAAGDAIESSGGSISHHHGIGRDHLPWYQREIGSLASAVLRAVKSELDPAGILNPGILIPGVPA